MELETLVESAAALIGPEEVEAGLFEQADGAAELGDVDDLGLVDEDDRAEGEDDEQEDETGEEPGALAGSAGFLGVGVLVHVGGLLSINRDNGHCEFYSVFSLLVR